MPNTCKYRYAIAFLITAIPGATRAQVSPYCTATNTNFDFGTVTVGSLVGATATATVTSTCVPGYPGSEQYESVLLLDRDRLEPHTASEIGLLHDPLSDL